MTLPQAGLIAAAPTVGFCWRSSAWGIVVDRIGERRVLVSGLACAARPRAPRCGPTSHSASSCCSAAWRPPAPTPPAAGWWWAGSRPPARLRDGRASDGTAPRRRGGRADRPDLAAAHGIGWALAVPAASARSRRWPVCVRGRPTTPAAGPRRPQGLSATRTGTERAVANPLVSLLLVVPQYLVWTFVLVWLMTDRTGPRRRPASSSPRPSCWARRPDRRRLVGPGRQPDGPAAPVAVAAAVPWRRWRSRTGSTRRLRRPDGGGLGDHGGRQRTRLHRGRGDRGPVLERQGTRRPEHRPVPRRRVRAAGVRCGDRDPRLSCRLRARRRAEPAAAPAGPRRHPPQT